MGLGADEGVPEEGEAARVEELQASYGTDPRLRAKAYPDAHAESDVAVLLVEFGDCAQVLDIGALGAVEIDLARQSSQIPVVLIF